LLYFPSLFLYNLWVHYEKILLFELAWPVFLDVFKISILESLNYLVGSTSSTIKLPHYLNSIFNLSIHLYFCFFS